LLGKKVFDDDIVVFVGQNIFIGVLDDLKLELFIISLMRVV
jgi:hypothetical protein